MYWLPFTFRLLSSALEVLDGAFAASSADEKVITTADYIISLVPGIYMFGECSKISNTFHFLLTNKILIIRTEIHKMFVRIANREDPDESLIWVCTVCLSLFWQATSVRNFSTFTLL